MSNPNYLNLRRGKLTSKMPLLVASLLLTLLAFHSEADASVKSSVKAQKKSAHLTSKKWDFLYQHLEKNTDSATNDEISSVGE